MPRFRQDKTNFTAGEISRALLGRSDLRAYDNGALTLRNVVIQPTGGVSRRAGLRFVDWAAGTGRLVAFEFNTEQTYLLVFTAASLAIYQGDNKVATLTAPWSAAHLASISWTQSADTLLVCHPDVPPQRLTRNPGGVWKLDVWVFHTDGDLVRQPYFKFADAAVTLQPAATDGSMMVTASAAIFDPQHSGTVLRIKGKQLRITSVASTTQVQATALETLPDTNATTAWDEQAFSHLRGWPVTAVYHQDRLVIGGSRDLPNRLWLSRSADLWNFDLGTGADDQAIEFGILSDQVNAIRALFSGRHLLIFTSGAEWMVTGDPLTPQTIQLNRQTRVGSPVDRTVPPRDVDGAILFVTRNGRELRQFLYTLDEQAYSAIDLALVARHLMNDPVDMDFDQRRRLLYVVMADGSIAVLTSYRAERITAWTRQETDGTVSAVALAGETAYVLLARGAGWTIERFDDALNLDAAVTGSADPPVASWSGLDHLEGQTVWAVADGAVVSDLTVTAGAITLDTPAGAVQVGLSYRHEIEPLPPNLLGQGGLGARFRLVDVLFRLHETAALRADVGRGLRYLPLHRLGVAAFTTAPAPLVSGDKRLRALGWPADGTRPAWRIEQDLPLPFALLSVTTELKVND